MKISRHFLICVSILLIIFSCAKSDSSSESTSGSPNAGTGTTDTTAPTKTVSPSSGSVLGLSPKIEITYSESVTGALTTGNYVLSGGSGTLVLANVTLVSGNTYRLTYSGQHSGGALTITLNNIKDSAGNALTGTTISYPAPTCSDGSKNGDETGVDCGGSCGNCKCSSCATVSNAACFSNNSAAGFCQPLASCSNSTKDGNESDMDCGGAGTVASPTAGCPLCASTKVCLANSDCASFICTNGTCN